MWFCVAPAVGTPGLGIPGLATAGLGGGMEEGRGEGDGKGDAPPFCRDEGVPKTEWGLLGARDIKFPTGLEC